MRTISELLSAKDQGPVHCVKSDDTLFFAVSRMAEKNIGAVLVMDDDTIKGIVSERDYLRFIAAEGHSARETPVSEIMTRKVIYVPPEATLDSVMATMTSARIRHLPVMSNDKLVGIVSIGDLVKQISADQEVHIQTLEHYISDSYPGPATSPKK